MLSLKKIEVFLDVNSLPAIMICCYSSAGAEGQIDRGTLLQKMLQMTLLHLSRV